MRHPFDDDDWPYVTTEETWGEVIAAGLVLFLLVFAFFGIVLTYGAAVMYP